MTANEGGTPRLTSPETGALIPESERRVAPELAIATLRFGDGSTFELPSRGDVVVLSFIAYWCPSCIAEARALAALHEEYASQGVRILMLDVDQASNESLLAEFRERTGAGRHLWALDRDFTVARAFEVNLLDTTLILDAEGRVAYRDTSAGRLDELRAATEALLQEAGASAAQ